MDEAVGGHSGYEIAIFVLVPLFVFVFAAALFYILCSKKYKLNWYEKSLLEAVPTQDPDDLRRIIVKRKVFNRKLDSVNTSGEADNRCSAESFWVPGKLSSSYTESEDEYDHSSVPNTPITPLGIKVPTFNLAAERLARKAVQPLNEAAASARGLTRNRPASMYSKLDHTKINRAMYQRSQESLGAGVIPEEVLGTMQLTLAYDKETSILTVNLLSIQNLVARDSGGNSANPYCKLGLHADSKQFLQTKVQKGTLTPNFNEEFVLEVTELSTAVLDVHVYDFDQFGQDECLGIVQVPLHDVDFNANASEPVALSKSVTPSCDTILPKEFGLGELQFSISYLPSAERLTVVIMRARNLKVALLGKPQIDPYVKVSLFLGGKRLKKKKTSTKRNTANPAFHEALVFSLQKDYLSSLTIELMVIHENVLGNTVIGRILLGPESKGLEYEHWQDVIHIRNATGRWHPLCAAVTSS